MRWLYCLQVALVDMLYRKSLRLSSAAKGEAGAGKIVNLQVCCGACMHLPQPVHLSWAPCMHLTKRV